MSMTSMILLARDKGESECLATVTVTSLDNISARFDIGGVPYALKLLAHMQDMSIASDNPNLPHLFYNRYELVVKNSPVLESRDVYPLLELRFTELANEMVSVEYSWLAKIDNDTKQGVHAILNMLAKGQNA